MCYSHSPWNKSFLCVHCLPWVSHWNRCDGYCLFLINGKNIIRTWLRAVIRPRVFLFSKTGEASLPRKILRAASAFGFNQLNWKQGLRSWQEHSEICHAMFYALGEQLQARKKGFSFINHPVRPVVRWKLSYYNYELFFVPEKQKRITEYSAYSFLSSFLLLPEQATRYSLKLCACCKVHRSSCIGISSWTHTGTSGPWASKQNINTVPSFLKCFFLI